MVYFNYQKLSCILTFNKYQVSSSSIKILTWYIIITKNLYIIQKPTSISDITRDIFLLFISFNAFLLTNQNGYWIIYFFISESKWINDLFIFHEPIKIDYDMIFFLYIETICFSLFSSTSSSHKKSLFSTPFSFLLFVYFLFFIVCLTFIIRMLIFIVISYVAIIRILF